MASSIDPMFVKLGVIGFVAYTGYGLALRGSLGTQAENWAYQLRSAWGGTPSRLISGSGGTPQVQPAGSSSPAASTITASSPSRRYLPTGLHDFGTGMGANGLPVVYDTQRKTIIQDPAAGGTNVYGPNDVFFDASGNTVSFDQAVEIATGRSA